MRFMDIRPISMAGVNCVISRSGYTGEDGFEIGTPARDAEKVARALLADQSVTLVGLGGRDSLRTEAGLCLYGCDIDESTTPVEAALGWAIPKVRRRGGARGGLFPGADVVLEQLDRGAPRCRVGLKPHGRTPVRAGVLLYADPSASQSIGAVTSGTFGASAAGPVAMGYVPRALSRPATLLFADVRGNRLPIEVTELPFVAHRYKRV
jgi:aminomethyltransferase